MAAAIAAVPTSFVPDTVFKSTRLAGWHTIGQADWKVENGEIVGTPKSPARWVAGSRQVLSGCRLLCVVPLRARAARPVSCSASKRLLTACMACWSPSTREISPPTTSSSTARAWKRAGKSWGPSPAAPSGTPLSLLRPLPGAAARDGEDGRDAGPRLPVAGMAGPAGLPVGMLEGEWNTIQVIMDADIIRPSLNQAGASGGGRGGIAPGVTGDGGDGYGPVALYVGGTGAVRFKDVSFKDLYSKSEPKEQSSKNFQVQRISDYFYSRGATAGDFNHDGILDIASGPFYYLGPDFTERREIELATAFDPSTQYPHLNGNFAYDFTGDGWDDIVAQAQNGGRPVYLYVNPKGENRRWAKYTIIPPTTTEDIYFKDIDGDGKPEIVYGGGGVMAYAKPDPADPTKPWIIHKVSEKIAVDIHGAGVGDINGDGRMDLLAPSGWWEHPKTETQ